MRAYSLWSDLHVGGGLPCAAKVLAHPDCDFADNAILVSVDKDCACTLTDVGANLPNPMSQLPAPLDTVPGRSVLSRLTEHVLEPIANRAPVGFEAEFVGDEGEAVLYRAIALPCARDGVAIDTVLGVISFLIQTDEEGLPSSDEVLELTQEAQNTTNLVQDQEGEKLSEDQVRNIVMSYQEKLNECMAIDGSLAVALVDSGSGMSLASEKGAGAKGLDLEVAAAGNTNVVRAKMDTMKNLGIKEEIEDILITLGSQIHMIRPATSESGKGLFIYLALDKAKANLAMARHKLRAIEKGLEV